MTREEAINYLISSGFSDEQVSEVVRALTYAPTIKNDLGVDCIDRAELLKAMNTWDKFGYSARYGLERLDKDDKGFVPYVHYEDMVNCVKGMPSVTPEITLEDVKGYCKPRCLTIISNELLYELTHPKIKALEQEPCDKCEVGNPCLYCKHEFEPQESEG